MDADPILPWMTLDDVATRKVSFAQNAEDILLERVLPDPTGLYVDVGANDPVFHSVTKRFYDRGWRGLNVEPNPTLFRRLVEHRPHDVNLNEGVGAAPGVLTFFDFPAVHGWSTFVPELAAHYRALGLAAVERPVPVRTLAEICAEHVGDRTIDFLKIDVEGFEAQVLLGGDWSRWRPRIVVLEHTWFEGWEPYLLARSYTFTLYDGVNRYYVRNEEPELMARLGAPVNVHDLYVPYDLIRLIDGLRSETVADKTRRVLVGRLKGWARRHPRFKAAAKRLLRRAG